MNAHFLEIALVRLSAKLLGIELIDNYAFHGSLPRFKDLSLKGVAEAEGIEQTPEKAANFNFGALCGRVISKNLGTLSEKDYLYLDAEIARNVFLDLSTEKISIYTEGEIYSSVKLIIESLVKKAQIRTHTAKPGGEDINKWLSDYYDLQKGFNSFLSSLVGEIVSPNAEMKAKYPLFFDKQDAIIALALAKAASKDELKAIKEITPKSAFGKLLMEVLNNYQSS